MTAENTAGAVSHRCVSAPSAYRKGDTGWQMGQGESLATSAHLRNRVPKGAFERLERHKWKHLRAVLRGLGGSNAPRLPGGGHGDVLPLTRRVAVGSAMTPPTITGRRSDA